MNLNLQQLLATVGIAPETTKVGAELGSIVRSQESAEGHPNSLEMQTVGMGDSLAGSGRARRGDPADRRFPRRDHRRQADLCLEVGVG